MIGAAIMLASGNKRTANKLIEKLVNKYAEIAGEQVAYKMAGRVEGLKLTDKGSLKNGGNMEHFINLAELLEKEIGPVALRFTRETVEEVHLSQEEKEEIPDKYIRD
ncbi:MAG: hypothetical protein ABEJ93_00685 [Candidatus Nanohalobium sp.]